MTKKNTQIEAVLTYLKKHKKGITSKDAFELFGATRLSGLIFVLKRRGFKIETEIEHGMNKFGSVSTYARYKLVD